MLSHLMCLLANILGSTDLESFFLSLQKVLLDSTRLEPQDPFLSESCGAFGVSRSYLIVRVFMVKPLISSFKASCEEIFFLISLVCAGI